MTALARGLWKYLRLYVSITNCLHGHRLSLQENLAWRDWIWRAEPVSQPAGPGALILKFDTRVTHTKWNTQLWLSFVKKSSVEWNSFMWKVQHSWYSAHAVDARWLLVGCKDIHSPSMNYNHHPYSWAATWKTLWSKAESRFWIRATSLPLIGRNWMFFPTLPFADVNSCTRV